MDCRQSSGSEGRWGLGRGQGKEGQVSDHMMMVTAHAHMEHMYETEL